MNKYFHFLLDYSQVYIALVLFIVGRSFTMSITIYEHISASDAYLLYEVIAFFIVTFSTIGNAPFCGFD